MCSCVCEDMVVPEFGETQQSVCEAVDWPAEADMYISDQEDLRLLLQVQYLKMDKTDDELIFLLVDAIFQWCFFLSPRIMQNCKDDSLNVAVPMRMLEIFSSERTYLLVIPDANYVASLLEQILHYMVQKGKLTYYCSILVY